ncbi:MAG: hypothetical protein CUN55_08695 [Phototrophicales bacterium]|nr:MAG: hypothetical protein CUN55_08695 [Phototrophicales bacterium]
MADKIAANRRGVLTPSQRIPIISAAIVSGFGFIIFSIIGFVMLWGLVQTLPFTGFFGLLMLLFSGMSMFFLIVVLYTNAEMFVPEALDTKAVRWTRGPLTIKYSERDRPEMPFVYIVNDYSFAPFVAPYEIPMEEGREYIVYYTPRSRLLLSIAPADQTESKDWLPIPPDSA